MSTGRIIAVTVGALLGWMSCLPVPGVHARQTAPEAQAGASPTDVWLARRLVQNSGRFAFPGPVEAPESGYRAAAGILEEAARLDPDEAAILRRLANAREAAGEDASEVDAILRQIARLEPGDTVVQMRLIQSAIDARQSVQDRLALCRRFLEPEAARRLAPTIVSRIAYQAVQLQTEQGRTDIDRAMLEMATKLDPTFLDAAALNMLETDRRTGRHDQRARALVAVVKADPTNRAALMDLIAVLKDAGAYESATALLDVVNALAARRSSVLSDDDFAVYVMMRAALDGVDAGLDLIQRRQLEFNRVERRQRRIDWLAQKRAERENAIARGLVPPEVPASAPTFEEVEVALSLDLTSARVLLAILSEDAQQIDSALEALEGQLAKSISEIDGLDASELPESAKAALARERFGYEMLRAQARLWANRHVDATVKEIATWPLDDAQVLRLQGWSAVRTSHPDRALSILEPLAQSDQIAGVGLAMAHHSAGQARAAAQALAGAYALDRGSAVGIWARMRLEQLLGQPLPESREQRSIEREIGDVPEKLLDLIKRPQNYFSLSITPALVRVHPLDRVVLNVTLRNDAPWPMAVGPDRLLNSRIALVTVTQLAGNRLDRRSTPLTVDLNRRFALKPGESMTVPVALDLTRIGLLFPTLAAFPMSVQVQGILDYGVLEDGSLYPTAWSLIRESSAIQITPWFEATGDASWMGGATEVEGEEAEFRAIAKLACVLHSRLMGSIRAENAPGLVSASDGAIEAFVDRWPELDDRTRAWAVLIIPTPHASDQVSIPALDRLKTMAQRDNGPMTMLAWLSSRTSSPDDVMLDTAARSEHRDLQELAANIRAFLKRTPAADNATVPEK